MPVIELELERVSDGFTIDPATGAAAKVEEAICCRWRLDGDRRWQRFTLIPDRRANPLVYLEAALTVVDRELEAAAATS